LTGERASSALLERGQKAFYDVVSTRNHRLAVLSINSVESADGVLRYFCQHWRVHIRGEYFGIVDQVSDDSVEQEEVPTIRPLFPKQGGSLG
jgi:hypothetical protein